MVNTLLTLETGDNSMSTDLPIQDAGIAMSESDYLDTEKGSEFKREYINGKAFAMAGGTINHGRIVANLTRHLSAHLTGKPCEVLTQDIKVRAGANYFYPDVLVDCNQMPGDSLICSLPLLIVEVLSKSTRTTDMTRKLISYINIPSLHEYVLIEQDEMIVQVLRKPNDWEPENYGPGDSVNFVSIGLSLPIAAIYDRILMATNQEA